MVNMFGFKFFEPEPVRSFWRECLDAIPKVSKPVPVKAKVTVDRKVLIAAGCVATAYLVYKCRNKLRSCLPGYQRLKTALGCEPPVVISTMAYNDKKVCYESVRSGSVEAAQLKPKSQVFVGEMKAGEFHAVGSAVRMRNYLVMPSHVFASVDRPCLKGNQHWIEVDKDREYLELDTDLIAFKMTEKELSTIGVAQSSISHTLPYSGEYVSVVGLSGKGTTGTLRHDRIVFGRVIYEGTTVAGYSGSGYYSGSRLVGIHTNGGQTNGGYSSSYIYSLICYHDRVRDEDSEDWLRSVHKRNKSRFRVDKRWGDLDDVRVEVGGRYAVVSRDSMSAAFGNNWIDEFDDIDVNYGVRSHGYDDFENKPSESKSIVEPSGEAMGSDAGGSNQLVNTPDQSTQEIASLMNQFLQLSQRRRKEILSILRQSAQSSNIPQNAQAQMGIRNTTV